MPTNMPGHHDDDQRARAGVVDLAHDEHRGLRQRRADARQDLAEEQRHRADAAQRHDGQ